MSEFSDNLPHEAVLEMESTLQLSCTVLDLHYL